MTDRELMQMALDALEWCYDVTEWPANGESAQDKAIEALRARLAEPEREWQSLTDEECLQNPYCAGENDCEVIQLARAIEDALKGKNEIPSPR